MEIKTNIGWKKERRKKQEGKILSEEAHQNYFPYPWSAKSQERNFFIRGPQSSETNTLLTGELKKIKVKSRNSKLKLHLESINKS